MNILFFHKAERKSNRIDYEKGIPRKDILGSNHNIENISNKLRKKIYAYTLSLFLAYSKKY